MVRLVMLGCLGAAFVLSASSALAAADVPELRVGRPLFWNGGTIDGGTARIFGVENPCQATSFDWRYAFRISDTADELRIAIDVPMRDDSWVFVVRGPNGSREACNYNTYSEEVRLKNPVPGLYRIEVGTNDATDSSFRVRAGLFDERKAKGPVRFTPPNLTVTPPFELGFIAPANPLNGAWPPDDLNPPLAVGPIHPMSCAVDETQESGATRCLRFSSGPMNEGLGPFHILLSSGGVAHQRLYRSDGSYVDREAGTHSFHTTHLHEHYTDVLFYELYRADPKRKVLEAIGTGTKSGFCPADQLLANWRSFANSEPYEASSDCSSSVALSTGWGDVYRWQRPGQYVPFPNAGGHYVVTATADVHGWVRETSERDNVSYAFIEVQDEDIQILERGRGRGPWDPNKRVVHDRFDRVR